MADSSVVGNIYRCKPRQARRFIVDCIQAGLVPSLISSPGVGKSTICRSIAKDFRLKLIDHRLSTSEPTDMTGLPRFMPNGRARFAPFEDLFPLEGDPIPEGFDGWMLFLDEANAAPRGVQAACYKIVLDRMIGQFRLHPNVVMVMAGNLATDRAIVNPLSTAMQSRLIHIEMEVDFEQWLEDVALRENYDPRIIAFLSQFPSKLMDFRPDHHERTFCCPRTWEFVQRLVTEPGTNKPRPVDDEMAILLTGAVTSGVAMEFVEFTKVYADMISTAQIRKDPLKCPLPKNTSLKWAVIMHMMEKLDAKSFEDLAIYADRFDLPFQILFYRSALVRQPGLREHPEFGKHAQKIIKYLSAD